MTARTATATATGHSPAAGSAAGPASAPASVAAPAALADAPGSGAGRAPEPGRAPGGSPARSLMLLPPELSAAQAARTALAGPEPVTYGELAARVDALAGALAALAPARPQDEPQSPASPASPAAGVGTAATRERVAVWMDKGPRYAEAVLAALHAGCAYVPLDAGQPAGRVAHILGDAEPVALLTDARHLSLLADVPLPASVAALVVADAEPDGEPGAEPHADPAGTPTGPEGTGPRPVRWSDFTAGAAAIRVPGAVPAPAPEPVPAPGSTTRSVPAPGSASVAGPAPAAASAPVRMAVRVEPHPDDLAAILYTSGSTGVPKGVRISHRNLTAFIGWARTELEVGPDDVFANHASFNFDLSTFDLFTAISSGAALWIVPDGRTRDVAALAAGIRDFGVTVWYSVPSVLHMLTTSGALTAESAASLRYVLFAGEVYPIPHLRELAGVLPAGAALYNLYGPTETNVCTYHRVRPEDLGRTSPVPIGRPLPGARARVLDDDGHEIGTGTGEIGELVVEGDCVTAGYWNRDTESRAAGHREGRHATGDLVSWEQGSLVYRGRKDRMVKLHGYRVELGEIEAALLRHPAVATAGVVVTGDGPDARVVACYTPAAGAARPNLLDLKRHCARHLPAYMVPRSAVCVDALPYSANGKIDYPRLAGTVAAGAGRSV